MNKYLFTRMFQYFFYVICLVTCFNTWASNNLSVKDTQDKYHINSASQAIGFFPIPDKLLNENKQNKISYEDLFEYAENIYIDNTSLGNNLAVHNKKGLHTSVRPDFTQHKSYGLLIPIENETNKQDWYVHISHYLIDKVDVFTKSNGLITHSTIQSTNIDSATYSINMLGRAVPIKMPTHKKTQLFIVITSGNTGLPLYVGLMSDKHYQTWKHDMDLMFILATGIVLGFVLLSLTSFVMSGDQTFFWFAVSTSLLLYFSIVRSPFGINTLDTLNGLPFWIWIVIGFLQVSVLLFVKAFLSIASKSISAKAFNIAVGLIILCVLTSQFTDNAVNVRLFNVSSLLVVLLVISFGMIKAIKHGTVYIIFMLGWLPLVYTISKTLLLQSSTPSVDEVTLSYHNIEGLYFQVLHFFIHFVAIIVRIINIKKEKIAAETKSDAKTTFLAQLSHDLRQPLDAMGLMLEHVVNNTKEPKNLDLLLKTKQVHKSMSDTFGALIDISQLDAGKVNVNLTTVNLEDIFDEVRLEHEHNIHIRGLEIRYSTANVCITSDYILLKRMLNNLVSNACKYTTKGGIFLSLRQRKASLLLQVWDTGCGISKSDTASIFDLYEQASEPDKGQDMTKNPKGHGVGLATVRQIAELLGYSVSVKSVVNKGSVFSINIPSPNTHLQPSPSANLKKTNNVSGALRIVNAILDETLADSLNHYLTLWGYPNATRSGVISDNTSAIQTTVLFVDDDNLASLHKTFKNDLSAKQKISTANVYVGYFSVNLCVSDAVQNELNKTLISPTVNVLTKPLKPAQLRAFINFVESQAYL